MKTVVDPTCEDQGYTAYECSRCGVTKEDDYVPATGHSEGEGVVTTPAECETTGMMTYYCELCGKELRTEIIPALDHIYGKGVYTEPKCGKDGFWTYTCDVCGDIHVVVDEGSSLVHNYVGVVTTAPTCTSEGVMTYTCSNCGDRYTEPIEKLSHNYAGVVTAPTCENQGYTTYTCYECGDSYVDDYVDALGHDWDDGVVTIPATHETEGEMIYTCNNCGETRIEVIPKLPSDNTISVSGVEIAFEVVNGVLTLRPTQEQMITILATPDKTVVFDLCGLPSSVELYVGANWFKDVDKTITIKTDDGEASITTKQLWNNSDKTQLITVNNGKLQTKNV